MLARTPDYDPYHEPEDEKLPLADRLLAALGMLGALAFIIFLVWMAYSS
jgi:hypothetical protein